MLITQRRARRGNDPPVPPASWHNVAPRDLGPASLNVAPDPRRHGFDLMTRRMPPLDQAEDDLMSQVSGE